MTVTPQTVRAQCMAVNGETYGVRTVGRGLPVLWLHGFTGSGLLGYDIAHRLADDHRWILPDLLGHGCSTSPSCADRYGVEFAVADLVALLDACSVDACTVIGYSMGGRLALALTLLHPLRVRALVLESASPGLRLESDRAARRERDEALADRIVRDGVPAFVEDWEQLPLFQTQSHVATDVKRLQRQVRLAQRADGLAGSLRGMGTGAQPSWWERLTDVKPPTLLLTGALDVKFSEIASEMTGLMPNVRHAVVGEAGHTIHLEQPGPYRSLLSSFLLDTRA